MEASLKSRPNLGVSQGWSIALWSIQILLVATFAMAGASKFQPAAELARAMPWTLEAPLGLVRTIGLAELLGALGLLLPSLTRIQPRLTVLAGAGLVIVMALAAMFHASRGEHGVIPE